MEPLVVTFGRALKIWWSYTWRGFVLMLLVMIPFQIFMFSYFFSHIPKPGQDPAEALRMAGGIMTAWPFLVAALLALQVQAMRWMLNRARWSDFRVALLPRDQ